MDATALARTQNASSTFDWSRLERGGIYGAKRPLLAIAGSKGFAGCGYFDDHVCATLGISTYVRFSGVDCHDDFLDREVLDMSASAEALGISIGMSGRDSLPILC